MSHQQVWPTCQSKRKSCQIYKSDTLDIWLSHDTRIKKTWYTCKWVSLSLSVKSNRHGRGNENHVTHIKYRENKFLMVHVRHVVCIVRVCVCVWRMCVRVCVRVCVCVCTSVWERVEVTGRSDGHESRGKTHRSWRECNNLSTSADLAAPPLSCTAAPATWLVHMCDMAESCARHDSFMCATWRIHMYYIFSWYVRHSSFEDSA